MRKLVNCKSFGKKESCAALFVVRNVHALSSQPTSSPLQFPVFTSASSLARIALISPVSGCRSAFKIAERNFLKCPDVSLSTSFCKLRPSKTETNAVINLRYSGALKSRPVLLGKQLADCSHVAIIRWIARWTRLGRIRARQGNARGDYPRIVICYFVKLQQCKPPFGVWGSNPTTTWYSWQFARPSVQS